MIIIITIIVVVVVVVASIITTMIIIFQSGSPVSLGDFHRWSLPAERLDFFFPSRTWKQFLVVWVLCIL